MIGPFFYDPLMSLDDVDSFSKSASKPRRFMELMDHHYRTSPRALVVPVTQADLYRVHDKHFVDGVFGGSVQNGFHNFDQRVPQACLWTCGAMVSAALHAPYRQMPVCVPASGFHHAGYDFAEGYCTFNGLTLAADAFVQANPGAKVAILDLDFHFGNGTDHILTSLPELQRNVLHLTSGLYFHPEDDPDEFFLWLEECVEEINAFKPDLLLYQAGADMHKDDPLGGILDNAQMEQRDLTVFRKLLYPTVWNLAGGYQPGDDMHSNPVLQLHRMTVGASNKSGAARMKIKERDRP
ncbi:hypothetical protein DIC66_03725 [Rhodoferax lacus]|uniref:Histone deacetylase domain-containing protein n=1 Tax=Rhodoferax lacus TaxID=2184758 RepID=A0A3E1REQ1_9BURK|nr:hypothetical protein [Rhodoferax lacus]RFO97848.1 hypothetical protein DIC66_03725 [Rhodoferax lacus]